MSTSAAILITTFNRSDRLERLLRYYRQTRCALPLVVADSSAAPHRQENERLVRAHHDALPLELRTFDPETPFLVKAARTLAEVDADFVAICADDDFVLARAVQACAAFLEAHPGHAVAHGRAVAIAPTVAPQGDAPGVRAIRYPQRAVEQADPAARLRDHLASYRTTFYSVHRREQLVENLRTTHDSDVGIRLNELLLSCLSVVQGKVGRLDCLYMVREGGFTTGNTAQPRLRELTTSADHRARYGRFRDRLAQALAEAGACDRAAAAAEVSSAMAPYLERWADAPGAAPNAPAAPTARERARDLLVRVYRPFLPVRRLIPAWARARVRTWLSLPPPPGPPLLEQLLAPTHPWRAEFLPVYRIFEDWLRTRTPPPA